MRKGYVVKISDDESPDIAVATVDQDELLTSLQRLVEGYIEIITLNKHIAMVIDGEGKLAGKDRNSLATDYLHYWRSDRKSDYIAGTALIVKLIPDDISAYDQKSHLKNVVIPQIRAVLNF